MYDHYYNSDFDYEKTCGNCNSVYDKRFNEACPECSFDDEIHVIEEFEFIQ